MFIDKEKESKEQLADTQKARELTRKVLELKQFKASADEEMKEALAELQELADEHPEWFRDADGKVMKSCDFGSAKLVWESQSPQYSFGHSDLDLIGKFVKKYPKSLDFRLKSMKNIDLEEFGIQIKEFAPKLVVEGVPSGI